MRDVRLLCLTANLEPPCMAHGFAKSGAEAGLGAAPGVRYCGRNYDSQRAELPGVAICGR